MWPKPSCIDSNIVTTDNPIHAVRMIPMCSLFPPSRPSKVVRPVRRSDEYLPPSKPVSRPSGGGGGVKRPTGPTAVSRVGGGGKVIDSHGKGGGAAPRKTGTPASAGRKPASGGGGGSKSKVCCQPVVVSFRAHLAPSQIFLNA